MAKKKKEEIIINEKVTPLSLSEVMHDSMIPFAESVIMDRALPRVEDGLKPGTAPHTLHHDGAFTFAG